MNKVETLFDFNDIFISKNNYKFFFKIIIVRLLIKNKSLKLIEEKILKDKRGSTTLKIFKMENYFIIEPKNIYLHNKIIQVFSIKKLIIIFFSKK